MTHTGPSYGDLNTRLDQKDYIGGSSTYDNLWHKDSGWPIWVEWTDRFNQKHKVVLKNASEEVTVWFPCGGKAVNWHHSGGTDRTGFDVLCNWCKVKFWHVNSNWVKNHGIRVHYQGYTNASTGFRDVDWDRVKKGLDAGKTVADILKELVEAGVAVAGAV